MLSTSERVDVSTWLPFGEQLRTLLNGDHIATSDLATLARSKGLFASGIERPRIISKTVPLEKLAPKCSLRRSP